MFFECLENMDFSFVFLYSIGIWVVCLSKVWFIFKCFVFLCKGSVNDVFVIVVDSDELVVGVVLERLRVDFGGVEVMEWEGDMLVVFEGFVVGEGGEVGSEDFSVVCVDDFVRGVYWYGGFILIEFCNEC